MIYTVDSSVFLNAFNPHEEGHDASRELMRRLHGDAAPIIVPTLLLPELAAAVVRGRRDAELARRFAEAVARLPQLVLVTLDTKLAEQACDAAAGHSLRGSDAVYAAVALRFGSVLITRDRQQRSRVSAVVVSRTPEEQLADLAETN